MAEMVENLKGMKCTTDVLLDGHTVFYKFTVYRLDEIIRTFYPIQYETECLTIPTSWRVEVKYERMEDGTYTFSVKLIRNDSLDHRMKASILVSFYDVYDSNASYPIADGKDRMVAGEELEATKDKILPEMLKEVVTVEVHITIRHCHTGSDWQCASKVNIDKNGMNLSKL